MILICIREISEVVLEGEIDFKEILTVKVPVDDVLQFWEKFEEMNGLSTRERIIFQMDCDGIFILFIELLSYCDHLIYIGIISEVVLRGEIDFTEILIVEVPALGKTRGNDRFIYA